MPLAYAGDVKRHSICGYWSASNDASIDPIVSDKIDGVVAWVVAHGGVLPVQRAKDPAEASLAWCYASLKFRCVRPLRDGVKPSERQLTSAEIIYFRRIAQAMAGRSELAMLKVAHQPGFVSRSKGRTSAHPKRPSSPGNHGRAPEGKQR